MSVEEWNSMWNDYAQNPSAALKWQQQYCHFMFQLEDASADGSIDCDEFTTVCSSYGIDYQECKVAFAKMAKVRKGAIEVRYCQVIFRRTPVLMAQTTLTRSSQKGLVMRYLRS